jgi:hypothetical protein
MARYKLLKDRRHTGRSFQLRLIGLEVGRELDGRSQNAAIAVVSIA